MYLYRRICKHEGDSAAKADLVKIWQPNERWQQFIDDMLRAYL